MTPPTWLRALPHRGTVAAVAGLGLLATTLGSSPASASPAPDASAFEDGDYVVTLVEEPAATYTGGVAGIPATRPEAGEHLDADSAPVRAYQRHLERQQDEVADEVGAEVTYQYTAAVNGFAAELTAEQAARLSATRGVLSVERDVARHVDTVDSPAFLGLTGPDGVWDRVGGPDVAGEGVVVGVIDTGITPDSASFAGEPVTATEPGEVGSTYRTEDGDIAVVKADGTTFEGECETGETFTADLCNSKLVSARYFASGFLQNVEPENRSEFEELSPRDGDGHGTHTAGTAVGNDGVDMVVGGQDFGTGSGMAPGAKLAVYKVCWQDVDPNTGGCYTSDSVAAIDQAVLDGVDVLNYSISGATTTSIDAVELAFLSAASAGVFVAASAGNSGPGASTVAHNSPWLTTVAASTHHNYLGTVVLGNGERYRGASITAQGLPEQTPVVLSGQVGAAGAAPDEARLCYPGTLDPAQVTGKVVVCDRGIIARVDKSVAVAQAGGVGMVLANTSPASTDADLHEVPTVHVDEQAGAAIKAYVSGAAQPTAALLPGDQTDADPIPVPVIAGFSSRGPALAHDGDLLKPDITAPGVSVLAAVAPGPNHGERFNFLSGTSMSSPHVAGLAALILGERPEWSPMAVKSAMMTTAYDLVEEDGTPDVDHFHSGAGHVDPTRFLTPGLVYESDELDWLSFLEGSEDVDLGIPGVEPIDPSDLNQPSIAIGALAGPQTVTRTVTATTPGIYRATASVPGMDVRITPSVLSFTSAGQSKTFKVTFTQGTAEAGAYAQGSLTWAGQHLTVRSPVVVRPVVVAAPLEVQGSVSDGSLSYEVTPGRSGSLDMTLDGLVPGQRERGDVVAGDPLAYGTANASTDIYRVQIPEGTSLFRADLQAGEGASDLDLYVTDESGRTVVAQSATGAADEQATWRDPRPGTYLVHVYGFSTVPSGGTYTLDDFVVGGPEGNALVQPDPLKARQGREAEITLRWSGLQEGTPYLGVVTYSAAGTPADLETVVSLS